MKHFQSLQEFLGYLHWPPTEHPMFSIVSLASLGDKRRSSSPPITSDFYMIKLKQIISGSMNYGRTKYDFSMGSMFFTAPGQVMEWDEVVVIDKGWVIVMHHDYLKGFPLANRIKTYGYFSYSVNEALHLSPREEEIVTAIFEAIESEYQNNQDEFSKEIIIGQLETLLRYSDRFYKRQFINRQELNSDLAFRFKQVLSQYYVSEQFLKLGAPNIELVANKLAVSPRYLSDALKAETGKTAMEHLHLYLIDEAKDLLLKPETTVAEIAYQLGFEYPQYFSRLFKKKVGLSPTAYRQQFIPH